MKTRVVRYCDVCLAFYKKKVRATYMAGANDTTSRSGSSTINNETITWYECSQHGPMQNHLGVLRIGRLLFSEWFRLHGFHYNPSTGAADFNLSDHPGKTIREFKPCPVTHVIQRHSILEALLRKPDGMVKR